MMRLCFFFALVFLFIFFASSAHAVRVFLINSTLYDPTTRIVTKTWEERNYTSTDSDGGVLIFDGALAENTTLEIRNIVAKHIDINATLSRGCKVIVENCTLFNPPGTESLDQRNAGLSIGSMLFNSSDGKLGCSKTSRSVSSSFDHKIFFIIRNNTILNVGFGFPLGPARGFVVNSSFFASIVIYNPIVCYKNNNNDKNDVVTADVVIENNLIRPMAVNTIGSTLYIIAIYPMHRISSGLVSECATSSSCIFEPNVPLSSLQIINNNFSASSPFVVAR